MLVIIGFDCFKNIERKIGCGVFFFIIVIYVNNNVVVV